MNFKLQREIRVYAGLVALLFGLLTGCGGGGGSGTSASTTTGNIAPQPVVTLSGTVTAGAGSADLATYTGNDVQLDASASKDPDGDALSYLWTLVSKPAGSKLELSRAASRATFRPDIDGTYVASLRVTDSKGASAEKQVTILARQNVPPVLTLNVNFDAQPYNAQPVTLPTQKANIGTSVFLDANASHDTNGGAVTTAWELIQRPANSNAALTTGTGTARLVIDVAGTYMIRVRGTALSGAYTEVIYPIETINDVPQTIVVGTMTNTTVSVGANTVNAAVGYTVALSSASSTSPTGNALTYAWTLVSKPAASAVQLTSATGAFSQLVPDVLGEYVVQVVATDSAGLSSSYQTTVSVKNQRPQAVIGTNATPVAMASGPTLRLPLKTTVTLRGTGSTDADGDPITYLWTMVSKPAGSTAALSATNTATVQLTTDVTGSYQVRLRVTDPAGAYSEQLLVIDSGNAPPVAVIDKSRMSVLAGAAVTASGNWSYDDDGDTLHYTWAIDARPAGSTAAIANASASQLSFTPDVAGTYVASLKVSDGKASSMAYVTIKALGSVTTNVALPFAPLEARYSRGLDRFVAVATNPNALYIVDPFTGSSRQVPLPLGVKAFNLSTDGKLAAVLHEGIVSLVDLENATLLHSSSTGGSQTDAFVSNAGIIYTIGQTGGQWVNPGVSVLNGRTGADLTATLGGSTNYAFYGTQRGIYAATKHKVFLISNGLSPADINYFNLDAATGAVTKYGDSPYHGDYSMGSPFFLTGNEDLLFTASGNFFRTDTLQYAGKLVLDNSLLSMSHSSTADEAIVMTFMPQWPGPAQYESSYHRFTGGLFLPDADIALPTIGGKQSYGIGIFHSANDNHVALVQTGSATQNAAGIAYYLVTR